MSSSEQQSPPLPVGLTLDRGFALLRRHPRALLVPQLVLNVVPLLFALLLVGIGYVLLGDVETHREVVRESTILGDSELRERDVWDLTDGQIVTLVVLGLIGGIVYAWFLIAAFVSVVRGADRALEGREHLKLRPAMKDALRATPAVFGVGIVFSLIVLAALLAVVVVVAIAALIFPALGVLVGIAAFLGLVWAGIRVFLWPFVLLSEGGGLGSFGRAWRMSKGRFWALTGVLVLVSIVLSVVSFVVSLILEVGLLGAAELSDEAGIVALVPYVVLSTIFALVFTAAFIGPVAVTYRTLSGRDTADLWQAALAMRPEGAAPDLAAPAPEPGARRWDAAEDPLDPPAPGWAPPGTPGPGSAGDAGGAGADGAEADRGGRDRADAGASEARSEPSGGVGGLPDPYDPSDAERRWGRGSGEPPAS